MPKLNQFYEKKQSTITYYKYILKNCYYGTHIFYAYVGLTIRRIILSIFLKNKYVHIIQYRMHDHHSDVQKTEYILWKRVDAFKMRSDNKTLSNKEENYL